MLGCSNEADLYEYLSIEADTSFFLEDPYTNVIRSKINNN